MTPTTSTTLTTTLSSAPADSPHTMNSHVLPASMHDAAAHLDHAQQIVLRLWTSTLPDLDGPRASAYLTAHRAINEARAVLGGAVIASQPSDLDARFDADATSDRSISHRSITRLSVARIGASTE